MSFDSPLFLEQIQMGPMENFVYLIGSKTTREVAIVDPAWNIDALLGHIEELGYTPTAALVTHYHPDHIGGAMMGQAIEGLPELLARQDVHVYVNKHEAAGVKKITGVADTDLVTVDSGDTLRIGEIEVEFLHTPGHTPGSQCFRIKNTLVSGDTLFIQGCGRVDLPGSDAEEMYYSLKRLAQLPEETILLPGHNYSHVTSASMGDVKRYNVHLRVPDLETWQSMMGHHE